MADWSVAAMPAPWSPQTCVPRREALVSDEASVLLMLGVVLPAEFMLPGRLRARPGGEDAPVATAP
ncbi:hypothetical protein ASB57_02645 [Bordetella sp. N]|nr:hypothetical protein ASB57_02645 [Bordetella sp. N]